MYKINLNGYEIISNEVIKNLNEFYPSISLVSGVLHKDSDGQMDLF
jgi:hypothetical protein